MQWLKGRALARLTTRTVMGPKPVRAVIEQVRVDDWCLVVEEHELGVYALAVSLRNMHGSTVASPNVMASPAMQRDLLPLMLDATRALRPLL